MCAKPTVCCEPLGFAKASDRDAVRELGFERWFFAVANESCIQFEQKNARRKPIKVCGKTQRFAVRTPPNPPQPPPGGLIVTYIGLVAGRERYWWSCFLIRKNVRRQRGSVRTIICQRG
jgi:hypothetical protein